MIISCEYEFDLEGRPPDRRWNTSGAEITSRFTIGYMEILKTLAHELSALELDQSSAVKVGFSVKNYGLDHGGEPDSFYQIIGWLEVGEGDG